MTARSVLGSVPTILPLNSLLSGSVTVSSLAPSTTWLLVMMYPSGDTITPEPIPPPRGSGGGIGPCGPNGPKGPKGERKNSSIGSRGPRSRIRATLDVMLTTAGVTALVTSVKPGAGAVATCVAGLTAAGVARRSEEHTSELQSRLHLVCRLLLEK